MVHAASMGVRPDEFWELTLYEVDVISRGFFKRFRLEQELIAWQTANLMNVHIAKGPKITPQKLLGTDKAKMSPVEVEAEMRRRQAKEMARKDLLPQLEADGDFDPLDEADEGDWWWTASESTADGDDEGGTLDEETEGI